MSCLKSHSKDAQSNVFLGHQFENQSDVFPKKETKGERKLNKGSASARTELLHMVTCFIIAFV